MQRSFEHVLSTDASRVHRVQIHGSSSVFSIGEFLRNFHRNVKLFMLFLDTPHVIF